MEFWKTVIFSDESKFNLFGSEGKRFVWRKPHTELNQKNIIPTVKHGGGHVMVWGCMSYHGVGNLVFIDGNMNADVYIDVLRNNLLTSATKMGIDGKFFSNKTTTRSRRLGKQENGYCIMYQNNSLHHLSRRILIR